MEGAVNTAIAGDGNSGPATVIQEASRFGRELEATGSAGQEGSNQEEAETRREKVKGGRGGTRKGGERSSGAREACPAEQGEEEQEAREGQGEEDEW